MYLGLMILVGSVVVSTINSNNSDNPNTDQENNKEQTRAITLMDPALNLMVSMRLSMVKHTDLKKNKPTY